MQELTAREKKAQIAAIGSILSNTRPAATYHFPGHDKPMTREQWLSDGNHTEERKQEKAEPQHETCEQVSLF